MSEEKSFSMACMKEKEELVPWSFDLMPLGPDDISIKITHCGVCHSDIHTIHGDWGEQKYPIVPGHEIIGYVTKVGENVSEFAPGQRVGVGPQAFSCGHCSQCLDHQENYCLQEFYFTYGSELPNGYITKGGYAEHQRVNKKFAVPIPSSLPSADAAPLLCAGITVYAPLKYGHVTKGKRVGVVGIGGLGHLGIKIAAAMGAEVFAISSSPSKEKEAKELGAHSFVVHSDKEKMKTLSKSFDLILNTVSANQDLGSLLELLKPHGTFSNVGMPTKPLELPPFVLARHLSVVGTLIGSPKEISEMLEFCAEKKILPWVEVAPLKDANHVIQKVLANKARYRFVLEIDPEFDRLQRGSSN